MTGSDRIHSRSFTVPADAIDENGHVNNVAYVQWMQKQARRAPFLRMFQESPISNAKNSLRAFGAPSSNGTCRK